MKKMQAVAMSEFMQKKLMCMPEGLVGRVISVHADLFNVLLKDGELLTIQTGRHVRTPMTIELSGRLILSVLASSPVYRLSGPDRLICGELELEFGDAVLFSSQVFVQHRDDFALAEQLLSKHLSSHFEKHSVFSYLVNRVGFYGDAVEADSVEQTYGNNLRASSSRLLLAISRGDADEATRAALSFVGLGPGMTPAGDDFLQGFLLFAQAHPAFHVIVGKLIEQLRNAQPLDTTLVSRALWGHCLAGRVSSAAVALVEAYNRGDWQVYIDQIQRIGEIGHSSGDDFLSGIWFALGWLGSKTFADNTGGKCGC